jgi:hypothetical protein
VGLNYYCTDDAQWRDVISKFAAEQVAEKKFGMLRVPQHEREITNEINSPPFVLSRVEGLREGFSSTC